ncbi:F-box only protein 41-like [Halichondria panicea]|uniref:F-box only protein 41-like n=1 Tax=Halichondria panicea TaxID=6063 RepID=UPI00312B96AB
MDNKSGESFGSDSQPLVGVSLGSVVQKANELACILQTCKHSLENQPSPSSWGRASAWLPTERSESTISRPTTIEAKPRHTTIISNDALLEQWHQLTSYIVSLEKEVQCYKQLIEECQQAQTVHTNGNSDTHLVLHPENSEEETASKTRARKQSSVPDQQYWDKLIEEDRMSQALLLVCHHLSTQELCAVSRVCKRWHTIIKHPQLWKHVTFAETVLYPQVLLRLSKMCAGTEKLTLHGLMPSMTEQDENLSSYIHRTRGSLEEAIEAILINSSKGIVSTSFTECNLMITDRILWLMSVYCPNLKYLSYSSDEFPPSAEALWSLTNGCKHLQHLHLLPVLGSPNQACFNDNALRVIAVGWSNLVSLTVGGKSFSAEGLAEIAHGCPSLCFLEIIHGEGIDKRVAELLCQDNGFSSLTSFVLNFTPSTHIALNHLLGSCKQLQRLDLHVTLNSYFTHAEANNPENISAYEQIIRNLKKLEKQARGRNVFHLFEH